MFIDENGKKIYRNLDWERRGFQGYDFSPTDKNLPNKLAEHLDNEENSVRGKISFEGLPTDYATSEQILGLQEQIADIPEAPTGFDPPADLEEALLAWGSAIQRQ